MKLTGVAAAAIISQAAFLIEAAAQVAVPVPAPATADNRLPVKFVKIPTGKNASLNVIKIDLSNGTLEMAHVTAADYPKRDRFDDIVRTASPTAAINACFFDMNSGKLVGHVYKDGRREIEGSFSSAFAIDSKNKPVIDRIGKLGDTSKYKLIIACVDILMKDGKVLVSSKADLVKNGHHPSKSNDIYKPARWSAIGIDRDGNAYLVATSAKMSIYTFVREVKEHTCITDLLGLDGGSSTGLYYRGSVVVRPSREIASVITVRPAEVKPQLIASR